MAVEVTAGDIVLMDPRLLHGAYANQSEQERSLITLWYLPDFSLLPESIQSRYMNIFNRQDLDTGDSAAGKLLDHWPNEHREALAHLEPIYCGNVEPLSWNRAPDQCQMLIQNDRLERLTSA